MGRVSPILISFTPDTGPKTYSGSPARGPEALLSNLKYSGPQHSWLPGIPGTRAYWVPSTPGSRVYPRPGYTRLPRSGHTRVPGICVHLGYAQIPGPPGSLKLGVKLPSRGRCQATQKHLCDRTHPSWSRVPEFYSSLVNLGSGLIQVPGWSGRGPGVDI